MPAQDLARGQDFASALAKAKGLAMEQVMAPDLARVLVMALLGPVRVQALHFFRTHQAPLRLR